MKDDRLISLKKALAEIDAMPPVKAEGHDFIEKTCLKTRLELLPPAQQWIPTSERTPEKSGNYLVTTPDGQVELRYYSTLYRWHGWVDMVAWMPLPPKWEGGTG